MTQENITINNMDIPIIKEGGKIYLPIKKLFERCLDTKISHTQLINNKNTCEYVQKFKVDYGYDTGGIQEVYCICKEGLRIYFKNYFKVGSYDSEHRKNINGLLEYLHIDLLPIDEQFIDIYDYKGKYDIFTEDCIEKVLINNKNIKWQRCSKCGNYYPYHRNFFNENYHSSAELNTVCKICNGGYMHLDMDNMGNRGENVESKEENEGTDLNKIYTKYGTEGYLNYRNMNTKKIYKTWKESNFKRKMPNELKDMDMNVIEIFNHCRNNQARYPQVIQNKNDMMTIIQYLYTNNKIKLENMNEQYLRENYHIHMETHRITQRDIYTMLFQNEWTEYPWRFTDIKLPKLSQEECVKIFWNYINEFNIDIPDVYSFDYKEIIKKCKLEHNISAYNNLLGFVMAIHNNKYGAYKFKVTGQKYWQNINNINQAMKFFIEEDIKIPINKIPLYLTKMALQKNARTLYDILYHGKFYKNLWEWTNAIYPNKFIEADFIINSYRDTFDSTEEMNINDVIHNNFNNVIYNQRNTDRTIIIDKMIPDWIIFTDEHCWLIEYFGLWKDNGQGSKRNIDYVNKSKRKITKYNKLKEYKSLFIYPTDLDNDFEGLNNKLKQIS